MKAVVLSGPGKLAVVDTPAPSLDSANGLAILRPRLNGICGSDLAAFHGKAPTMTYPRILGHELLATVESCPSRPELEGGRVVVEPINPCGSCRACRTGRANCCARLQVLGVQIDGTLTERVAVDARRLYPVADHLDDELAVLAEPTSVAYHAVQRASAEAGQVAVVFGAGTIGLLVAQLLMRARGCRVVVTDVDPWRRQLAARLGATACDNDGALLPVVESLSAGDLADVVVEATGHPACTARTTEVVGSGGRIVLVGWNQGPTPVDTVTLMRREVDLLGSRASTGIFPNVVRLLEDGLVDAAPMITHRLPFDAAGEAFELLGSAKEHSLKVVIDAP